jgi:hypothetical protein
VAVESVDAATPASFVVALVAAVVAMVLVVSTVMALVSVLVVGVMLMLGVPAAAIVVALAVLLPVSAPPAIDALGALALIAVDGALEARPRIRKLAADLEAAPPALAVVARARAALSHLAQAGATLARRVVEVDDDVGQRGEVEQVVLRRQLERPARHGALELEGQVAFVVHGQLEQAAVVLAVPRGHSLGRAEAPQHVRALLLVCPPAGTPAGLAARGARAAAVSVGARLADSTGDVRMTLLSSRSLQWMPVSCPTRTGC